MPSQEEKNTPPTASQRKKNERLFIVLAFLGLLLLVLVQRRLLNLGPGLSSNQGVITLVSINFSVLVLGVLLFLILSGLYRVFFERQAYGNLQTKLVVAFISLSLIPTLLIFYFSYLLVGKDHETWFSLSLIDTIEESIQVVNDAIETQNILFYLKTERLLNNLENLNSPPNTQLFEKLRQEGGFDSLEWYSPEGERLVFAPSQNGLSPLNPSLFREIATKKTQEAPNFTSAINFAPLPLAFEQITPYLDRKITRVTLQYPPPGKIGPQGFLVIGSLEKNLLNLRLLKLYQGLEKQQAATGIARPFKVIQLTSLAAVTLVAVFLTIWIGSHLARSLAAPITELVEGTRRVASGELGFILTPVHRSGEMTELVSSFNQMTQKVKESYIELDNRRRFVETVLKQVSTGVIALDNHSRIISINEAATSMLKLTAPEATALPTPQIISKLLALLPPSASPKRQVTLNLNPVLSLVLSRARLKDEDGETLGWLITFDDISELEKAQRLSAWREVARRIAHEIKNPLTPISLAAQRLKRRFEDKLQEDPEFGIFQECTSVIVRQVDNMRLLVDEFSQFARLPQTNPRPADLLPVLEESLALFREAHPRIDFKLTILSLPKVFIFDPEQLGRVVTNLLLNSAQAIQGQGTIEVFLSLTDLGVTFSISDDGPGFPPETKERIFEPYVTSGAGQGLGLSIVKTIVTDHGGFIRVLDREPKGTTFEVTLPYRQPTVF
ncbi:MAG: HAMP domain-containing protein [Deltaproteobacteria bacterium]|jgi:two-component system nitrogen regulation sensor histidine kinase NtrY|nr:HAMP domain-containing protein [Deltaproteobacteria bacterium]